MRILQITRFYALTGGAEKTARLAARGLRAEGHDVLTAHGDANAAGEPDAVYLPAVARARPGRPRGALRALQRLAARFRPDVIHFHLFDDPLTVRALNRKTPVVRSSHGSWPYCPSGTKYWPGRREVCDRPFGGGCIAGARRWGCARRDYLGDMGRLELAASLAACYAFRAVDARLGAVVVPSRWLADLMARAGADRRRLVVVPPPAEIPPVFVPLNGGPPRIAAVGRLTYVKGFDDVIRALGFLPRAVELVVAGAGPQEGALRDLARRLGVASRVAFLGWVPNAELPSVFAAAAVVALPTLCPEAFGHVGLEAMACGRPVVAYRVGGIPEWLEDGRVGFLAEPHHPRDLAAKLGKVLAAPAAAARMGEAGREAVVRYSAAAHARRLLAVYEEATARFKRLDR
jgi:glycosyltransferase involved in cell wall biosynthesis